MAAQSKAQVIAQINVCLAHIPTNDCQLIYSLAKTLYLCQHTKALTNGKEVREQIKADVHQSLMTEANQPIFKSSLPKPD